MVSRNSPMFRSVVRACEAVLNYLKLNEMRLGGHTYGSDMLLIDNESRQALFAMIQKQYLDMFGGICPLGIDDTLKTYSGCRKRNYVALRDGQPIHREEGRSLFGIEDTGPIATVYAYLGWNARAERRLIKIGYTAQNLTQYLRTKDIPHNPKLMATRCGGRKEEQREHAKWSRYLADGREWFWATDAMIADFRNNWDITADFETLAAAALQEAPWL
jgi:hypothetical protein